MPHNMPPLDQAIGPRRSARPLVWEHFGHSSKHMTGGLLIIAAHPLEIVIANRLVFVYAVADPNPDIHA